MRAVRFGELVAGTVVALGVVGSGALSCSSGDAPPASTAYTPIVPPSRPSGANPSGGTTRWYALRASHLGLTDKVTGAASTNAWRDYGFDLDGRNTTVDDSVAERDTCHKRSGALTGFLQDGNGGIDNNFGQHVVPTVRLFRSDVESFIDQGIASGSYGFLLRLDDVSDGDDPHVPGALYFTTPFDAGKSKPSFTASDHWPVSPGSLTDGTSLDKPKVTFPNGFIVGGAWVSGTPGGAPLDLALLVGADSGLPLESPVVVAPLGGGLGTVAGAISTSLLQTALTPVARRLGICPGDTTYEQVVKSLSLAADLVSGAPSLQDTSKTCDAISIGIGFELAPAGTPSGVGPTPPPPAPDGCGKGDAGSD